MVHHVYRVKDNNLIRFSLLSSGAVKKAQVLGDKLRFMAFEWTHLACPKTIYERMVESMTVKIPHPQKKETLQKKIAERYGADGTIGWFHRGSPVEALIAEYGTPQESGEGYLKWTQRFGDYFYDLKVAVKDEKFLYFHGEGFHLSGKAIAGTASWVGEQLEPPMDSDSVDPFAPGNADKSEQEREIPPKNKPSKTKWKEPDLEELTKVMVKNALSDEPLKSNRNIWCGVALEMIEKNADPKPLVNVFLKTLQISYGEKEFIFKHTSIEQQKAWHLAAIEKFWIAQKNGEQQYYAYPHFRLAYMVNSLHLVEPSAAKKLLGDLEKTGTPKTHALRLSLIEDWWSEEEHAKEILKQLTSLVSDFDNNFAEGLLDHLKEQYRFKPSGSTRAIIVELEKLKPRLKGRNLKWCKTALRRLQAYQ